RNHFLVIGGADQCQGGTIDSSAWLDNVWYKMLLRFFVKIIQRLATRFLMLVEIVIGSIGDSLQLWDAEWTLEFDMVRSVRIVGALLRWDFMDMKRLGG